MYTYAWVTPATEHMACKFGLDAGNAKAGPGHRKPLLQLPLLQLLQTIHDYKTQTRIDLLNCIASSFS